MKTSRLSNLQIIQMEKIIHMDVKHQGVNDHGKL
jgi:hypothetical protein